MAVSCRYSYVAWVVWLKAFALLFSPWALPLLLLFCLCPPKLYRLDFWLLPCPPLYTICTTKDGGKCNASLCRVHRGVWMKSEGNIYTLLGQQDAQFAMGFEELLHHHAPVANRGAGKQEQCCMPRFSLCCRDLKFSVQTPRRRLWKLVLHSARACGGKHRDTCNKHYSCHNILYAHECTDTHTNRLRHPHVAACLYHTARPKTTHKLKVLSQFNWERDGAS